VTTQVVSVEQVIDPTKQVVTRNMVVEVERIKEPILTASLLTHHDDALPSIDVFQDSQHLASCAGFSTESVGCRLSPPAWSSSLRRI
jgi:hypothetical protein